MARRAAAKPAPKPLGTRLPATWHTDTVKSWRVWAMLSKIPQSDYDVTAAAFETHSRGMLSDDWVREWRAWCRDILTGRRERPMRRGLFS